MSVMLDGWLSGMEVQHIFQPEEGSRGKADVKWRVEDLMLLDTNVLVDLVEDDPDLADWSIGQLRARRGSTLETRPLFHC
jgi:hypothetical protein